MTTMNVTQTGVEVWVQNTATANISQVGLEVWVHNTASLELTQVGLEIWRTIDSGSTLMVITQTGVEVWEFLPFVPPLSSNRVIIIIMGG